MSVNVPSVAAFSRTLLCQEKPVSLLECDAVSRVLVVGRESGRVRAFGHGAIEDLAECVDALARCRVFSVHKMHIDEWAVERSVSD